MIRIAAMQYEDGEVVTQTAEYCGTDGEITAICCLAVRKAARMQRIPVSQVMMDIERHLEGTEEAGI